MTDKPPAWVVDVMEELAYALPKNKGAEMYIMPPEWLVHLANIAERCLKRWNRQHEHTQTLGPNGTGTFTFGNTPGIKWPDETPDIKLPKFCCGDHVCVEPDISVERTVLCMKFDGRAWQYTVSTPLTSWTDESQLRPGLNCIPLLQNYHLVRKS